MKKIIYRILVGIAILAIAAYLMRAPLLALLKENITENMFVSADTDNFDPGLEIGSPFPQLHALYQDEVIADLTPFMGAAGMVVVANRSAEWCPYCMRQLVELQENIASFNSVNISVVAITYDAPQLQQEFIQAQGISYPFLSDVDARSMQALEILNTEYQPGERAYGIPYPGVYVVNPDMQIVGKLFIEPYSVRVDAAGVLAYARQALTQP